MPQIIETWRVHPERTDILVSNTGRCVRVTGAKELRVTDQKRVRTVWVRIVGQAVRLNIGYDRMTGSFAPKVIHRKGGYKGTVDNHELKSKDQPMLTRAEAERKRNYDPRRVDREGISNLSLAAKIKKGLL